MFQRKKQNGKKSTKCCHIFSSLQFPARSTESGPFRIDPDSGLITLARSLPETVPVYMLNITAYDDGSCCPGRISLSSDTYILVEIRDTNNNQPQFPDCSYEPEVPENQPVGTNVVKVTYNFCN